jgi:hypothetical protein
MKKFAEFQPQNEGLKDKLIGGLAALSIMISSCQSITPEEKSRLQKEIEVLNIQEEHGKKTSKSLREQKDKLESDIKVAKKKLGILQSGKTPKYILKLEFQEHKMEISIDRMDFEFEIPVDEEFYNESEVGKELGEGSRSFSIGHSGDITVIGKRIE